MVTVRAVLELPELQGAKVLAGTEGLDRVVRTVTVAEVTDIYDWLGGDDFVHSVVGTFGVGAEGEKQLCEWAEKLLEHGASCFAIKTKRYLEDIPESLLKMGNEQKFPIIELPEDIPQSHVTEAVLRAIIDSYQSSEKMNAEVFRKLCERMIGPHQTKNILNELYSYIGYPCLIETDDFELLAFSGSQGKEALEKRRSSECLQERRRCIDKILLGATDFQYACGEETIFERIWPIYAKEQLLGFLTVLSCEKEIPDAVSRLVTTCMSAFALDLSQQMMDGTSMGQMKSEFIQQLLSSDFDEAELLHLAKLIGFNAEKNMSAFVVWYENEAQMNRQTNYYYKKVAQFTEKETAMSFSFSHQGKLILLIDTENKKEDYASRLAEQLYQYLLQGNLQSKIIIGIGCQRNHLSGIRQSILEAAQAVRYMNDFQTEKTIMSYGELGEYALLSAMVQNTVLADSFCEHVLGKVLQYDRDSRTELMGTLEAYISCNGNYTETGKVKHLHVNTVKYRMNQVRELLPVELDTISGRSTVWSALNVYRYRNQ